MMPLNIFRLLPKKDTVKIKLALNRKTLLFQNIQMSQFGIQVNIATTGHKPQEISKDNIIVVDRNYGVLNWVYFVLSLLKMLSGLFPMKPLNSQIFQEKL